MSDDRHERDDMALLLVHMGMDDGGRVLPSRILDRRPNSSTRQAFLDAQANGWLDGDGCVTQAGRAAVAAWEES